MGRSQSSRSVCGSSCCRRRGLAFSRIPFLASTSKPLAETSKSLAKKRVSERGESGSPMNINARILKENRLRKAKAEKQIISRGCARGSYERIARAYYRDLF